MSHSPVSHRNITSVFKTLLFVNDPPVRLGSNYRELFRSIKKYPTNEELTVLILTQHTANEVQRLIQTQIFMICWVVK